jgi:hypothetical protein
LDAPAKRFADDIIVDPALNEIVGRGVVIAVE